MENLCTPEICHNGSNFCSSTFFHSDSAAKWGSGGGGGFLQLHTLQHWKMPSCKIGDLQESQLIVYHPICDSSLLCRKDNYKLPIDRNPNAHMKCIILYVTHLESFYCISETQGKVSQYIMRSSTQNFSSGHLPG